MPIVNPSQYNCDQMQPGDVVYVHKRNFLYRWYRDLFLKDKIKIKVRKDWNSIEQYNIYYQEDCILLYAWEVQCVQVYNEEVLCSISLYPASKPLTQVCLKSLKIGLYNIQLIFNNNLTLTLPVNYFEYGIKNNENTLKKIQDDRIILESLKFQKYKGYHFKNVVNKKQLENWTASYCSVCGKPIIFHFKENKVEIENQCNCGTLKSIMPEMTYDELALWYSNQTNPNVKKIYEEFWFSKGQESNE